MLGPGGSQVGAEVVWGRVVMVSGVGPVYQGENDWVKRKALHWQSARVG